MSCTATLIDPAHLSTLEIQSEAAAVSACHSAGPIRLVNFGCCYHILLWQIWRQERTLAHAQTNWGWSQCWTIVLSRSSYLRHHHKPRMGEQANAGLA